VTAAAEARRRANAGDTAAARPGRARSLRRDEVNEWTDLEEWTDLDERLLAAWQADPDPDNALRGVVLALLLTTVLALAVALTTRVAL
jgi:hypothetical protein